VSIKAVTFDFWDTLFPRLGRDGGGSPETLRPKLLREFLLDSGQDHPFERCEAAYARADRDHLQSWVTDMRQPLVDRALDEMCAELGIELDEKQREGLALSMQCLDELEDLGPFAGVSDLVPALAEEHKLGIVSDTWLTPGSVPRDMLERRGLLASFSVFVFSDETGFLKPHERQFRIALDALDAAPGEVVHVGDSERRDVMGARSMGMRTVLLDWEGTHGESVADAVVRDFRELPKALAGLA